jgi:hypothetical protein
MAFALAVFAPPATARQPVGPYGAHSMVYAYAMPFAQKERAFAEAKGLGASQIRLDIEMDAVFTRRRSGEIRRNWTGVDEVVDLSRRYDLPILAILIGVPRFLSTCSGAQSQKCAAADPAAYGGYAGEVARHTQGAIDFFEIMNEPDTELMFRGTPEDYARMLAAADGAIGTRSPGSRVVLGGVSDLDARDWLNRAFATPGAAAAGSFDIAGVHVRGGVGSLGNSVRLWREFFNAHGRANAPLWITEHGYPADTAYQYDAGYRGGEAAQTAFIRDSLPTLLRAGAARVFVSTRDTWPNEFGPQSPFNSEGVATLARSAPYSVRRKPAGTVVRWLASIWPTIPHTVGDEARLTTARNENAVAGFGLAKRREELSKQASDLRRAITRLRHRTRRAERAGRPRQVRSLRRQTRRSLRKLAYLKRTLASASARAAARFVQVKAYQAQLDAVP